MQVCLRQIMLTILSLSLASCMVGPDFHAPSSPETRSYTKTPLPKKTVGITGNAGKAQYFVQGKDIPAQWWTLFHSRALNDLILQGLANSPNLAAAKSTLYQAQEILTAQIGTLLYPAVNLQLSAQREKFIPTTVGVTSSPSSVFSLYDAGVNVSYTLDVFGGSRRQIEASKAQVDYQVFQLEAAYLTLTSNIVTTTVTTASLQAQVQATQELIKAQSNQLNIVKKQFQLGAVSDVEVSSLETQVGQTRASLPPLEQSLAQSRHALSVLLGVLPSESNLPTISLQQLSLPKYLPISLPSSLVRQRPDIRASEALLHVASAGVGVATANLYPQITLTGNYGWEDTTIAHLINPSNNLWAFGGNLLQPLFNAGALRAKKRAAVDNFQAALAQYQQTVLQAFQNVADSLRAIQNDAKRLQEQTLSEHAAKRSLQLVQEQYRLGGTGYLSLLIAQQQYQQAYIGRIQAQAARFADTAALFQALGGGWWNEPKCPTA